MLYKCCHFFISKYERGKCLSLLVAKTAFQRGTAAILSWPEKLGFGLHKHFPLTSVWH